MAISTLLTLRVLISFMTFSQTLAPSLLEEGWIWTISRASIKVLRLAWDGSRDVSFQVKASFQPKTGTS